LLGAYEIKRTTGVNGTSAISKESALRAAPDDLRRYARQCNLPVSRFESRIVFRYALEAVPKKFRDIALEFDDLDEHFGLSSLTKGMIEADHYFMKRVKAKIPELFH